MAGVMVQAVLLGVFLWFNLAVAGRYEGKNGRHNITMGHRLFSRNGPLDILLYNDRPKLDSSWMRAVSHDVCYPPKGHKTARFNITAFKVTDLVSKGKGGYAFIDEGGVGFEHLCLRLKTQRSGAYDFIVQIFGYYI